MREKKKNSQKLGSKYKIHVQLTLVDRIINKYSPNKRWIVMDIAAKQWGEYPPLSMALRWIIISICHTDTEKLVSIISFNIPKKRVENETLGTQICLFIGCSKEIVFVILLHISQSVYAKSTTTTKFTCVVYTNWI